MDDKIWHAIIFPAIAERFYEHYNTDDHWVWIHDNIKPGGHLAFVSTFKRSYPVACLIEDAGFEIRDTLIWLSADGPIMIVLARKALDGSVAENTLKHNCAGLNIDGCRIGTTTKLNSSKPKHERNGFIKGFVTGTETKMLSHGRWPANLIHDGSVAVTAQFPETGKSQGGRWALVGLHKMRGQEKPVVEGLKPGFGDSGTAARYFQTCKNKQELIDYIEKLITPIDGECCICW